MLNHTRRIYRPLARALALGLVLSAAAAAARADHYECIGGATLVPAKQRCSDGTLPLFIADAPAATRAYRAAPQAAASSAASPGTFAKRPGYVAAPSSPLVDDQAAADLDADKPPEKKWYEHQNISAPLPLYEPRRRVMRTASQGEFLPDPYTPFLPRASSKANEFINLQRPPMYNTNMASPLPPMGRKDPNRKWYEYQY
ncbi:MAG: hypothetical protein JNJ60_10635 [Rhodocyclaceae bacterium]|nr:hypothetical protein [Rhodocyclaceae bacterium]